MEQSTAAEQRAFAVAKLKRAASLPRMKDGRRPPMHAEAVSEGEKLPQNEENGEAHEIHKSQENGERKKVEEEEPEPMLEPQEDAEAPPEIEETRVTSPEPAARTKRRSRSRSRSRTSKDLKGKGRAMQSPTPTALADGEESSPDEAPAPLPSGLASAPPLLSPVPSRLVGMQRAPFFMPAPLAADPTGFLYAGSSSPGPALQTLQTLQLVRSNSAAARLMAMSKLTGEPYDPSALGFGSPSPLPGKLGRNNTVSGGERSAARTNLFRSLRPRTNVPGDQTSGGEEFVAPSPPPKRRRRRSRRQSQNASTPVEESDLPSTSPNTPIVPPTPLPPTPGPFDVVQEPIRAPSATPSMTPSLAGSADQNREHTLAKLNGSYPSTAPEAPRKRRSVVIEEDDMPEEHHLPPPPPKPFSLPGTPRGPSPSQMQSALRAPHSSTAPSAASTDSASLTLSGVGVPVYLEPRGSTPRGERERWPASPFGTPWRERVGVQEQDHIREGEQDDEEEVVYGAEMHRRGQQNPFHDAYDREISWVADPVPESRMPVLEKEEDEEDEAEGQVEADDMEEHGMSSAAEESHTPAPPTDDDDTHTSRDSRALVIEPETSPEVIPLYMPPSPSTGAPPSAFPARMAVTSPALTERSPSLGAGASDWDDARRSAGESAPLKRGDGGAISTWEKVKHTFSITRTGSGSGRRSRSNSVAAREARENTDSSVSRESGASVVSARLEGAGTSPAAPQLSTSPSLVSLGPQTSWRGGVSPIPPATPADLEKYKQDAKLFPFPGMRMLEENRNRVRGISQSASSPDIPLALSNGTEGGDGHAPSSGSASSTPAQSPQMGRDRKLSHQASDTRLLARFNLASPAPPSLSTAPSSSSHMEYFNIVPASEPPSAAGALNLRLPLPTNREGVKRWLSKNRLFSSQSPTPTSSRPATADRPSFPLKKPSLTDLLRADWEEVRSSASKSPVIERSPSNATSTGSATASPVKAPAPNDAEVEAAPRMATPVNKAVALSDIERTPRVRTTAPDDVRTPERPAARALERAPPFPSPSDQPSSATPDPLSSLDDYPAHSTSGSSSHLSSRSSSSPHTDGPSKGDVVLERLDEMLGRGGRSPMWASAVDDPPRKLVLCSPVLQVVNANTVKDRFLFLFTDILVIAKPVMPEQDALLDPAKKNPEDRKFIVKSVVQLGQLRFCAEREDSHGGLLQLAGSPRHPLIRTFVHHFAKDPDHAISWLFDKTGKRDNPVALGQLLFRTLDLDRAQLGDYLSRRTSKFVLKAYLEGFGFKGLRIDKALRVFLQTVNVPSGYSHNYTPLEVLLDAFASRWYDANVGIVAYDKDMAVRLVRAVVQLNEVLHGGISQEPNPPSYLRRNVTVKDFTEAFRQRKLVPVSDELLGSIYNSVRRERLSQARRPGSSPPDALITIKRPLPVHLTYRMPSEPIVLRISQADPDLTIQLYGQDLSFEPPVLTFAKSSEASFRVTGMSLGSKTMIMARSGPSALLYTGLPLSSTVVVERAFMRNTFQVAFTNHVSVKRRYMFSVDDPVIRNEWITRLKQQIDVATSAAQPSISSPGSSKFHKAAEDTAFKVLRDTLIGSEPASSPPPKTADGAPRFGSSPHLNGTVRVQNDRRNNLLTSLAGRFDDRPSSAHIRSKSRSVVYNQHGPGKLEPELNNSSPSRDMNGGARDDVDKHEAQARVEGRLWSGRALELQCQQNSSIALVLAYLQVGAPDHRHKDS